ncbi:SAGA-associated factor [Lodderomyces elongisporus]|uniref:SAGA-associated factor n=1 Tax=Lodderomyces elongisporus TaxID=36914 RepID=UPI002924680D|nr:SAGA-associated factor [Lodderomyces elongisporus]WLF79850.1 SAGA-associated factor [Lodderomyces elongisporus]
MANENVTYGMVANSLLDDMINNIIRNQVVTHFADHACMAQATVSIPELDKLATNLQSADTNKDIFGQDRSKLKGIEASRYFSCDNCGRKIAGGRFAQHINKCLDRKRK